MSVVQSSMRLQIATVRDGKTVAVHTIDLDAPDIDIPVQAGDYLLYSLYESGSGGDYYPSNRPMQQISDLTGVHVVQTSHYVLN